MTAFDTVQVSGSHQNVLTMRMIEGLGLSYQDTKLLSLEDFPTGIKYHHDKKYMSRLSRHVIEPYNFHMFVESVAPVNLLFDVQFVGVGRRGRRTSSSIFDRQRCGT